MTKQLVIRRLDTRRRWARLMAAARRSALATLALLTQHMAQA